MLKGHLSQRLISLWLKLMYTVYVLKSLKNSKRYVGYTSKSVKQRLLEHNTGSSKFTKGNRPFVVVYTENYTDKTAARKREIFLKTGQGRQFLDNIISDWGH